MALSKTLQKGQTVLACQMCEEESKIKWKCLLCNFLMCDKCRKIHQKVKSSEEHKIVDLKSIASEEKPLGHIHDFYNIKCDKHSGKICCLFCKECEEVVCPLCITNAHNTHNMTEISAGFKVAMEVLRDLHACTNQDLTLLTTNMDTIQKIKTENLSSYSEKKQAILNQEKVLKDTIHEQSENLLSQLDDRVNNMNKPLQADGKKTKEDFEATALRSKFLKDVIDSNNVLKILKTAGKERTEKVEIKSVDTTKYRYKSLPNFFPGCIKQQTIASMYGSLKEIPCKPKFSFSKKIKTTFPPIQCMLYTNGSMWIGNYSSKKIEQISLLQDESIQKKRSVNASNVVRMQLSNSGDLFLSCHVSTLYMFQPSTGKIVPSKYTAAPLITTGAFEISKNNKIIVGAREGGPAQFPPNGPRKVIMMNMEGEHEMTYYLDNESKPIFTGPYRVTTDNNFDIYVIDIFNNDKEGRVIKLNQSGGVSDVYMGHPEINDSGHPFSPLDFKSTSSNNVIITDSQNDVLHILDNNVQCIHFVRTKEFGISYPLCIEIDNNESIFIACKSEIYKLNFSEV
ncbi:unnamed protein product [Mytilus coruscus]|uniref:B box-type domain-containing protein n=1 Tax=Mytilus coruscus TaxID=42192 RepID=A0A6J8DK37_MYTCO|nr:unnamed protein product [Mytilus coruscus]